MKTIKEIKNVNGEIVGLEINENLTLKELELAFPRKQYPREWKRLEKGLKTKIN